MPLFQSNIDRNSMSSPINNSKRKKGRISNRRSNDKENVIDSLFGVENMHLITDSDSNSGNIASSVDKQISSVTMGSKLNTRVSKNGLTKKATYARVADLANLHGGGIEKNKDMNISMPNLNLRNESTIVREALQNEIYSLEFCNYNRDEIRQGYNMCLLVGQVQVVIDSSRVDGTPVKIALAEVGDESGTIFFQGCGDHQINLLAQSSTSGCAIVLRNAILSRFTDREWALSVNRWGKMSQYPDKVASTPSPPLKINYRLNLSGVRLENTDEHCRSIATVPGENIVDKSLDYWDARSVSSVCSNNNALKSLERLLDAGEDKQEEEEENLFENRWEEDVLFKFQVPQSIPIPNETRNNEIYISKKAEGTKKTATYSKISDLAKVKDIDENEPSLHKVKSWKESAIMRDLLYFDVHAYADDSSTQSPTSNGYNFCLLVEKISIILDQVRVDGKRSRVGYAVVGDETGTILLQLIDHQVDVLMSCLHSTGVVVLRNCILKCEDKNECFLTVNKWGKITLHPDQVYSTPNPPLYINKKLNLSRIELEEAITFSDSVASFSSTLTSKKDLISESSMSSSESSCYSDYNSTLTDGKIPKQDDKKLNRDQYSMVLRQFKSREWERINKEKTFTPTLHHLWIEKLHHTRGDFEGIKEFLEDDTNLNSRQKEYILKQMEIIKDNDCIDKEKELCEQFEKAHDDGAKLDINDQSLSEVTAVAVTVCLIYFYTLFN